MMEGVRQLFKIEIRNIILRRFLPDGTWSILHKMLLNKGIKLLFCCWNFAQDGFFRILKKVQVRAADVRPILTGKKS